MLTSLKPFEHFRTGARDGDVGRIVDVLLDERHWTVRYLVVETGRFFNHRSVLLPVEAFVGPNWSQDRFDVTLSIDQVKHCPDIGTDEPVSRYMQRRMAAEYAPPFFWNSASLVGLGMAASMAAFNPAAPDDRDRHPAQQGHLRSARELRSYRVLLKDGTTAQVSDFIADESTWQVKYVSIRVANRNLLVSPHDIRAISWNDRTIELRTDSASLPRGTQWDSTIRSHDAYATALAE